MNLSNLITLSLDASKCIGCGACMSNRPVGAIKVNAGVGCTQAIFNGGDCNC